MRVLGIETSCDETSAAVVEDGRRIRSNIVASQIDLHAAFGGVFPEVASRAHIETIDQVVSTALTEAGVTWADIDSIAVTRGPGLVGSLLVGINYAKGLALALDKPLIGINHLEGHIYSLWLNEDEEAIAFPALVLIVSGGHTELLLMRDHGVYERLGGTLDDAAGEAFDKVGRLLGLPFPGGPNIERAAQTGDASAFDFPRARPDSPYDFSFSGLKTAVMRAATVQPGKKTPADQRHLHPLKSGVIVADVAASFQKALVGALVEKTAAAARGLGVRTVLLAGGVSANHALRTGLASAIEVPVRVPPLSLCSDNAAMIAAAAYYRLRAGAYNTLNMDVKPIWRLAADAHMDT